MKGQIYIQLAQKLIASVKGFFDALLKRALREMLFSHFR
jgi:hypothetical protein